MLIFLGVVGSVAAAFFLISAFLKFSEWLDAEDAGRSIERKIPFSLFQASYQREPEKWDTYAYFVVWHTEHENYKVSFSTIRDRGRYRRWYAQKEKQEERERIDEQNRKLMDSIAEGYMESVTVESKPVESKPVESKPVKAEVSAEREWSVKRCGDCRRFWMQNPEQCSGYCGQVYPARFNQHSYDMACEGFVEAKEREEVKS